MTCSAPEDLVLPDLDSSEGAGCDESRVGDGGIDPTPPRVQKIQNKRRMRWERETENYISYITSEQTFN